MTILTMTRWVKIRKSVKDVISVRWSSGCVCVWSYSRSVLALLLRPLYLTCTLYIILYSYTLYCPEASSTAIIYSAKCLYPILWKFSFLRFEKTRRQKWRQLKSSLFSGHKILHWGRKLFGPDSVVRQDSVQGAWRYHYHYHYRGQNSLRLRYTLLCYMLHLSIYVKISPECVTKNENLDVSAFIYSHISKMIAMLSNTPV